MRCDPPRPCLQRFINMNHNAAAGVILYVQLMKFPILVVTVSSHAQNAILTAAKEQDCDGFSLFLFLFLFFLGVFAAIRSAET